MCKHLPLNQYALVLSAENNKAAGVDNLKPAFVKQDDCIHEVQKRVTRCIT